MDIVNKQAVLSCICTYTDILRFPFSTRTLFMHLQEVFLPQGYPDSVSDDYLSYQLWDTLQVGSQCTGPNLMKCQ